MKKNVVDTGENTGVIDTGGKFAADVVDTGGELDIRLSPKISAKIWIDPSIISGSLGKRIHENNLNKNFVTLSL